MIAWIGLIAFAIVLLALLYSPRRWVKAAAFACILVMGAAALAGLHLY
jgi:presenilin-like A22 family membrane protease